MAIVNVKTQTGATDDAKIDAAFAAASDGDTLYFASRNAAEGGPYKVASAHDFTSKNVNILGDGTAPTTQNAYNTSRIELATPFTGNYLFRLGRTHASGTPVVLRSRFFIRDIMFAGDLTTSPTSTPPVGPTGTQINAVEITTANYVSMNNVEIRQFNGSGLFLKHVEDMVIDGIRIMKCGRSGDRPAFDMIPVTYTTDTGSVEIVPNSIHVFGSTIESSYATGVRLLRARTIKFLGCKFHGVSPPDTIETYTPNALLNIDSGHSNQVIGCQFVYANKYAIHLEGTADVMPVVISGNTFHAPTDLNTGGTAKIFFIRVDRGFHVIDNNSFRNLVSNNPAYTNRGGDIWLNTDAKSCVGTNLHGHDFGSSGGVMIKKDSSATYLAPTAIAAY